MITTGKRVRRLAAAGVLAAAAGMLAACGSGGHTQGNTSGQQTSADVRQQSESSDAQKETGSSGAEKPSGTADAEKKAEAGGTKQASGSSGAKKESVSSGTGEKSGSSGTQKADAGGNQAKKPADTRKDNAKTGSGHTVCIDPGHQAQGNSETEPVGPGSSEKKAKVASGTSGTVTGLNEYELNLQVSRRLRTALKNRGYRVVMTRTSNRVNISNVERAKLANRSGAEIYVRIHANGVSDSSAHGAMAICMSPSNRYNAGLYKKSRKLSSSVIKHLCAATGARSEGVVERDDLSGNNWSKIPVTLVELGYMTNPREDQQMASPSYQKKLADGIADGIDQYFA
jgi:N-acetylmuramoyl-L-alanine amidase